MKCALSSLGLKGVIGIILPDFRVRAHIFWQNTAQFLSERACTFCPAVKSNDLVLTDDFMNNMSVNVSALSCDREWKM